jgi:Ca2+-binding EF-hand superfamily protein
MSVESEIVGEEEMDLERLRLLFRSLDLDGDGRIDLGELVAALRKTGHAEGAVELAKVPETPSLPTHSS